MSSGENNRLDMTLNGMGFDTKYYQLLAMGGHGAGYQGEALKPEHLKEFMHIKEGERFGVCCSDTTGSMVLYTERGHLGVGEVAKKIGPDKVITFLAEQFKVREDPNYARKHNMVP